MNFKNETHEKMFEKVIKKVGEETKKNCKYCSAIFILSSLNDDKKILYYVSNEGIDFENLVEVSGKCWSINEKELVKLAATLFNEEIWNVSLDDVFRNLHQENFDIAIEALKIRYR